MLMSNDNLPDLPENFDTLTHAAEHLLSEVFRDPIYFTGVERLSEPDRRNLLLRCICSPNSDLPASYIIKKVEAESYQPDNPDSWDSQRFFNDWIGSRFLSSLEAGTDHGPHFYAGSRELGFIVLEDLGPHRSLVEPLLDEDAASARAALLRYSTRLGKLHADTIGRLSQFEELFHLVNPAGKPLRAREREIQETIHHVQNRLESLGVEYPTSLSRELQIIKQTVIDPGPFLAYIHSDPCPDNLFDDGQQMRLIDFEFSRFGHALIDAAYGRMIFPTCWCANRIPPSIVADMERQYRAELIQGCPAAKQDRLFEGALVTICGFWLLTTLGWHLERALEEDHEWGRASLRQRILARLEAFAMTAEEFGDLPALRATARRLLELLQKRWPETAQLEFYPAFRIA
jgi:hypothetical protein